MSTPDTKNDAANAPEQLNDVRNKAAIAAMHGELASQCDGVDWSGRPDELAVLAASYADELVRVLRDTGYNSTTQKGGLP